ncbi:MAG TPA: GNAT family N-acetyltransferase [Terracidiphilus sp.]
MGNSAIILQQDQRRPAVQIRDAVQADLEQITAIYNEVLSTTTAIYNDRPATVDERISWWRSRVAQGLPVLVAADGGHVAGFGSFGDFRAWPGYRFTVEGSVHIRAGSRGQGVGTELLNAILARAKAAGKHIMIAGVDSENAASLRFLERFGFERVGHLREVGYKFDRFLDLVFLEYWITPPARQSENQS